MNTDTWVQCTECGSIYRIPYPVDINKLYIMSYCNKCGSMIALNLSEDENEIYKYLDTNKDPRYYNY